MLEKGSKIHMIGIGGYGMSALAKLLLEMGYQVSGSDLTPSDITRQLAKMGADIKIGHNEANIEGSHLVVFSTAIPEDNKELIAARQRKLAVHRAELLAHFLNSRRGIAVTGAHGKTTTTAMLALILEESGLDPTALIGGAVPEFAGTARLGRGEYVIAEACESDQSFALYRPWGAIITNIEADHLEHYQGDFNRLLAGYARFLENISSAGLLIYPATDQWVNPILEHALCRKISFGLDQGDYHAEVIELLPRGSRFKLFYRQQELATIALNIPGRHNVANAIAAAAIALELGVEARSVTGALARFKGAKRRFQILVDSKIMMIDDYAHHPTEIRATLAAARNSCRNRLIAVFQPHRYTRTQYLADDFTMAFTDADMVIVDDIYAASEEPIPGVSSEVLVQGIKALHKGRVEYIRGIRQIAGRIAKLIQPGDTIVTMGAGDIWKVSHGLAELWQDNNN